MPVQDQVADGEAAKPGKGCIAAVDLSTGLLGSNWPGVQGAGWWQAQCTTGQLQQNIPWQVAHWLLTKSCKSPCASMNSAQQRLNEQGQHALRH